MRAEETRGRERDWEKDRGRDRKQAGGSGSTKGRERAGARERDNTGRERDGAGYKARKRKTAPNLLLVLCYLFIIAATCWAEYVSYHIPMGQGRINEWNILKFFTNDSNILLAFSCLLALPAALRGRHMGRGLLCLRYMATVCTGLTFWTVLLFLGPLFGYANMYHHEDFYLHVTGPVLAFLLFTFVERERKIRNWEVFLSALPMALYGAVYAYMVVFARKWYDFYGFVATGYWPLVYVGMLFITLLLGLFHARVHNRFWKGNGQERGKMAKKTDNKRSYF